MPHSIRFTDGAVLTLNRDGEVLRERVLNARIPGSWSSTIQIRSDVPGKSLWIDGNPSKFLLGHNVYGYHDLEALLRDFLTALGNYLPEASLDVAAAKIPDARVCMVDICRAYLVGVEGVCSERAAAEYIQAVGQQASMKFRGRASVNEGTVYFTPHSRRAALKCYAKGLEVKRHADKWPVDVRDKLLECARPMVRWEARYFAQELKRLDLETVGDLEGRGSDLLDRLVGNVSMACELRPGADLAGLHAGERMALLAWQNGEDVRAAIPSRATFYRYRARLLAHCGIDIAVRQPRVMRNVVTVRRVADMAEAPIPDWVQRLAS